MYNVHVAVVDGKNTNNPLRIYYITSVCRHMPVTISFIISYHFSTY
jgi:hypothetical protein